MSTNRKTYFSFNVAPEIQAPGLNDYTDYSTIELKPSKKRLYVTVLGTAVLSSVFAPSIPNYQVTDECNYIACVADIIEQARKETSPQTLCETLGLHMQKPHWLPTHKYLLGGSDLDDETNYNLLPIREYGVGMELGSLEKGMPPTFISWEDELEDVLYHV